MTPPDFAEPARLDATLVLDGNLESVAPGPDHGVHELPQIPGYEIQSVLGRGACGVVFRAKQLKLDRTVALKTIAIEGGRMMARFEKEAFALAKLQHPHIVNVFDSGTYGERVFFAMELLIGSDLERHIETYGALEESTAWSIARQCAAALAHAADAGIIHRDIKPANLFLVAPPTGYPLPPGVPMVKVTDFGLALDLDAAAKGDHRLTRAGTVVGTPIYMAPEQFTDPDIDSRADIYALGATVHHMLNGTAPFDGKSIWEVMSKKTNPVLPPIAARISRNSAELVAAMLRPNPDHRIGTYAELLARIDGLTGARDPEKSERAARRRWGPRSIILAVATVITAMAFVASLVAALSQWLHTAPGADGFAPIRYVSNGNFAPLFNNRNLVGWNTNDGQWGIEEDSVEGGKKLVGRGALKLPLVGKPPFRLAVGLEIRDEVTVVELLVAQSRGPADRAKHHILKIARGGVQLGTKTGALGTWEPTGAPVAYPTRDQLGDSVPYLPVVIEVLGDRWLVKFNRMEVGVIPDDGALGLTEVNFFVRSGRVRIESVIFEGLKPAE